MIILAFGLLSLAIWLGVLSYFFWKLQKHYLLLTKGAEGKNLQDILEVLVKDVRMAQSQVKELHQRTAVVEEDGKMHLQKVGLVRFNPFNDTGGDQSFILALVDAQDTGFVISGLYARTGTRWYAKRVIKGKGSEHTLSEEEKKALHLAKNS